MPTIDQHNDMIRELVAYGDTIDMCAYDLVHGLAMDTLPTDRAAKVRSIIEHVYDNTSDSLLEDIMDDMSGDDDYND